MCGGNMRVKCLANNGMGVSKYTLEHGGYTIHSRLPMHINDTYVVYGQIISNRVLEYLIIGSEENLPSWYAAELFEVVDTILPMEYYYNFFNNEEGISAIWGFKELVEDENYLYNLEEREDSAVRIFLKRKKEIDEFLEFKS
jgi:hypothetical protein